MEYTTSRFGVNIDCQGFVIDLGSLYDYLSQLEDRRSARGVRYSLVTILVFVVLAKLSGEDRLTGISEWVWHRKEALAQALNLTHPQAPHRTTYSRILGEVINIEEFDVVVHKFFTRACDITGDIACDGREWIQLTVDGKTLRGSIVTGQTRGVHLLAAYDPAQGLVLAQVEVDGKENEIKAAPRLLQCIDLRGKVVSADAMLTQRQVSVQIVDAGGHYVWTVKDNQPQLRDDIATLFEGEECVPGFSPAIKDFSSATTIDKGHGRIEQRTLLASAELKGYVDWPYAQQVFKIERDVERVKDGKITHEITYGITSLEEDQASPHRLLEIVRTHWQIENGLHYRRDETLREDWCHLRIGHTQRMMAAINNLVLGLLLRRGVKNVPRERRRYAAHWNEALKLITTVT